jgi:outer membrane protein assembly factor BamB
LLSASGLLLAGIANAADGKLVWERRSQLRIDNAATGSLLSTSTGLVFGSDLSMFFALDAATARLPWSVALSGKTCTKRQRALAPCLASIFISLRPPFHAGTILARPIVLETP